MARRAAIFVIYLLLLLVIFDVPSSEAYPARFNEEFDPRIMPTVTDPSGVTVKTPVIEYKPDPLENIGVKLSQGFLIEGDIRIRHVVPTQESFRLETASNKKSLTNPIPTKSHQIRMIPEGALWLEKVIPYEIDTGFNSTEKQTILDAMDEVMTSVNRCIQFVPREKQDDFLYIAGHQDGCQSDVGKQGGNQSVSISRASECVSKGIIMHELLHALGLWHEHSRVDRDDYIEIIYHNIRADHINDFGINYNSKNLTEYDYYSIMHYKTNQFSKFALMFDTIRIKQPGIDDTKVGQREYLSDKDRKKISILYQCQKTLRTSLNDLSLQSEVLENALRPTTNDKRATLNVVEAGRGNPNKVLTSPTVTKKDNKQPELVKEPSKATVRTNVEVVSETVLNMSTSTSKKDIDAKLNQTETFEIGKK